MAQNDTSHQVILLRAVTYRLTSTPAGQLPKVIPHICSQLASCRDILSAPENNGSKAEAGISALVHKLKTRVSSLLQDRVAESRWAGVTIAKTAIESSGFPILQDCLPWVRAILGNLAKDDPPSTKRLSIICLTRIFVLTREHQSLVREITTPNLPTFITTCIQAAKSISQLAGTIFECFCQLIGRHPAIFRPYADQLRPLLLAYISLEEGIHFAFSAQESARRALVQLHECVPKNASAAEWQASFRHAVTCVHEDTDQIYRSVLEDWESSSGYQPIQHSIQVLSDVPARGEMNHLGLSPWSGVHDGAQRIIHLLLLIRAYIRSSNTFVVDFAIGPLTDLLKRLLSMTRTSSARDWEVSGRADVRFESKERDDLALVLPSIHLAAAQVAISLLTRLHDSSASIFFPLLDHLIWVFECEHSEWDLRCSIYEAIAALLSLHGPSLNKDAVQALQIVAAVCCKDLLADDRGIESPGKPINGNSGVTLSSIRSQLNATTNSMRHRAPSNSAYELLAVLLGSLRADLIPRPMRSELERAAVLARHKPAMIASMQNFSVHHQSLLPLLARLFPLHNDIQGLVKPRMPVLLSVVEAVAKEIQEDIDSSGEAPLLNGLSVGRLHQAAYAVLDNEFYASTTTVDHLFPIDGSLKGPGTKTEKSVWMTNTSGTTGPIQEVDQSSEDRLPRARKRVQSDSDSRDGSKRQRQDPGGDVAAKDATFEDRDPAEEPRTMQEAVTLVPARLRASTSQDPPLPNAATSLAHSTQAVGQVSDFQNAANEDDSDEDADFEIPELHFRAESDDEDEGN